VAYDGAARDLVHALKLHGMTAAADVMAAQISATAPPDILADTVLVPVPGNPGRRRGRGFDPAEAIARALRRRTGLPMQALLRTAGRGPAQAGGSRAARLRRATAGAIQVCGRAPARALLVDDVHTTGATLDACARALRAAGTRSVAAVIYARTLG
jgi:predicted amidophosphoribosyltransferase